MTGSDRSGKRAEHAHAAVASQSRRGACGSRYPHFVALIRFERVVRERVSSRRCGALCCVVSSSYRVASRRIASNLSGFGRDDALDRSPRKAPEHHASVYIPRSFVCRARRRVVPRDDRKKVFSVYTESNTQLATHANVPSSPFVLSLRDGNTGLTGDVGIVKTHSYPVRVRDEILVTS